MTSTQAQAASGSRRAMERYVRRTLAVLSTGALALIAAHIGAALWAQHEVTQNESAVAIHSLGLASGQGLYHKLGSYPYTVSPYMPLFYAAQAALHRLGLPPFQAGRLLSILGLTGILWGVWKILRLCTGETHATWAGTLLAASTANLMFWGTVGQVDVLGLCFSITALYFFLRYRRAQETRFLLLPGAFVLAALFTKQTLLAAGFTIFVCLAFENRRRAVRFAVCIAAVGISLAAGVNYGTSGGFLENTVFANINPFSFVKFAAQLRYLAPVACGSMLIALVGLPASIREGLHPLYIYAGASMAVLLSTGSKIGADLNYQLETMTALALCAGWSLHRLRFFPLCFEKSRSSVTLLQAPLLVYIALNLVMSGRILSDRISQEMRRRQEYAQLRPYLDSAKGPVISVQFDPLVQSGRRLEVEPLIYTLMVGAGRVDPGPVCRDLAAGKFSLVILFEDLLHPAAVPRNAELPSLPAPALDAIRRNYRLVEHIPGSLLAGDYIYEPAAAN
ncbi:MAG TPA: glycosyltransferase family 39 protein [Bryobacterales bacterium]|nr:glycosyltransferase family 39 protein [Bryobacterales bacterium]